MVVADARGQVDPRDQVGRQPELAEQGVGGLVVLLDDQHLVAAAVLLQVVAEIGLHALGDVKLAERVHPVVLEAPEGVLIELVERAGGREVVVEGVVVGVPVVPVALEVEAQPVHRLIVDLHRRQVFLAGVDVARHAVWLGIIDVAVRVLVRGAEAQVVGEVVGVLAAQRQDLIAAPPMGRAGLVVLGPEGQIAVRLVGRAVDHELALADAVAEEGVQVGALVGVPGHRDAALGRPGEGPRDDVDRPGQGGGAVEQGLAAFQHLDPVHHGGRQGVERRGAGVEPVVDPDPVDQPEHVLGA